MNEYSGLVDAGVIGDIPCVHNCKGTSMNTGGFEMVLQTSCGDVGDRVDMPLKSAIVVV